MESVINFDPTEAALRQIVELTKNITADDLRDRTQVELVRKNRIALKNARVQIEKKGKSLREEATAYAKSVIAKEKGLIGIIEPEENRLSEIEEEAKQIEILDERKAKLPERRLAISEIGDGVSEPTDDFLNSMGNEAFSVYVSNRKLSKQNTDVERTIKEQAEKQAELDRREREIRQKEIDAENEKKTEQKRVEDEARRKNEIAEAEQRAAQKAIADKRAQDEADEKRKRDKEASQEKSRKFKKFLDENGVTPENRHEFEFRGGVLWKMVSRYEIVS